MNDETYWKQAAFRFKTNLPALVTLWVLGAIFFLAIIGPWLSPYAYTEIHLSSKNLPPSSQFWFGTDELGRDLFTRVWWGARISLGIGIAAAFIDVILG